MIFSTFRVQNYAHLFARTIIYELNINEYEDGVMIKCLQSDDCAFENQYEI